MKFFRIVLAFFILSISGSFAIPPTIPSDKAATFTLTVVIKNIRNKNGRIQLQVYRNQASFSAESPWKQLYISKDDMKDNTLTYKLTGLVTGVYGLALLDDENKDKEMNYSWLMPSEGFGFSDYYHTAWSKPKFDQFKFSFTENKQVSMKIRYM